MSRNAYACIARGAVCEDTIAGENGVYSLLRNFMADFELTMALSGCKDIREIMQIVCSERKSSTIFRAKTHLKTTRRLQRS